MTGLIRVPPEQLAGVAAQLNGGASSIEATLSQLSAQVTPLGSDWAGVGQAKFQALWLQWHTASRQLHQALSDMSVLMRQASVAYETNDAQVGASFK
ncbi:MAG TPA: WXG100 family type VII secretion target [Streptosporangiaceae bacterium]|jgi:WXG100 family type VII secretion target